MIRVDRLFGRLPASRIAGVATALCLAGCSVLTPLPDPVTVDDRLSALPTRGFDLQEPVLIRWSRQMIPFIEAKTDDDAAYALGLVHAHLRLGQLAVARRVAQGRISESAGPFTIDLDTAIRAFGFGRSVDEIYARMPDASRRWIQRYAAGINAYADQLGPDQIPHEMRVMEIEWEPWVPEDSLLLGRVSGIDINWETILTLLQIEDRSSRTRIFARLQDALGSDAMTFGSAADTAPALTSLTRLAALSRQIARAGSNSMVLAPSRSASGGALIANDPHLAFFIPNPWLIAGLRSPSYEIVGMMVPGTPVFGFGRTRHIAWGGTNLRATTSELVDLGGVSEADFEIETHQIGVRLWPDTETSSRMSAYGPVMSDLEATPPVDTAFAVRWIGHSASDELTALLQVMRARSVEEFRQSLESYALPSQTFLVADTEGTIGSVIATQVPARPPGDPLPLLVTPEASDRNWQEIRTSLDLPAEVDPLSGVLASANNRPAPDGQRPFGGFFPQDERVRRLQAMLGEKARFRLDDLKAMQIDVVSPLSLEALALLGPSLSVWAPRSRVEAEALDLLLTWDGSYHADSRPALVFEAFMGRFTETAFTALDRSTDWEVFARLGRERAILLADLDDLSPVDLTASLSAGLTAASEIMAAGLVWGDVHKLDVQHIFGNVPIIGDRYRIGTIPVAGSRETVMKTAHPLTVGEHRTFFGAQARHLSDLADPDANYFVLLGGQDGWLGSPGFIDQVDLWRSGELLQVPLTQASLRSWAYRTTELSAGR
ncbi:MAG: penicillin acylase family protein [Pseudomonadota bacterium]